MRHPPTFGTSSNSGKTRLFHHKIRWEWNLEIKVTSTLQPLPKLKGSRDVPGLRRGLSSIRSGVWWRLALGCMVGCGIAATKRFFVAPFAIHRGGVRPLLHPQTYGCSTPPMACKILGIPCKYTFWSDVSPLIFVSSQFHSGGFFLFRSNASKNMNNKVEEDIAKDEIDWWKIFARRISH